MSDKHIKAEPMSKFLLSLARKIKKDELLLGCIHMNDEEFTSSFILEDVSISINIQNLI